MNAPSQSTAGSHRPTLLVVAESDSYLKWGVSRGLEAQESFDVEVAVVRAAVAPSLEQITNAVDGRIPRPPAVVGFKDLIARLRSDPPDALLLACRGPLIDVILREAFTPSVRRPITAAGIPGIWYPPTQEGLRLREAVDVLIVHSRRERRAVTARGRDPETVALASLVAPEPPGNGPARRRIVFAPQALVPARRTDRERILATLVTVAESSPELDVVVKLRGRAGEAQTHDEADPYESLVGTDRLPGNLVFEHGHLRHFLSGCEGFVTVSSTAALEAVAAGTPTLCLDDFGVDERNINLVFAGSGLLGGLDRLAEADFPAPNPGWLEDNYFHSTSDDDWTELLVRRAIAARSEPPPALPAPPRGVRAAVARWRLRHTALGAGDTRARYWLARAADQVSKPLRGSAGHRL